MADRLMLLKGRLDEAGGKKNPKIMINSPHEELWVPQDAVGDCLHTGETLYSSGTLEPRCTLSLADRSCDALDSSVCTGICGISWYHTVSYCGVFRIRYVASFFKFLAHSLH